MKLLVFLINLFVLTAFSQTQITSSGDINGFSVSVNISEMNYKTINNGVFTIRDYYEFNDVSKHGEYKIPTKDILIAIPPNSNPQINILLEDYVTVKNCLLTINEDVSEGNYFNTSFINKITKQKKESSLYEIKGFLWVRDFFCVHIKLRAITFDENNTFVIENKKFKISISFIEPILLKPQSKVISNNLFEEELYDLIINKDIAEQFRSNPQVVTADTTANWINYNLTYVKLGTIQDGIYRIFKSDLELLGINTGLINPKEFKLYESGKEESILVKGEEDGIFDALDYIEFYGHKNYNLISPRVINTNGKPYNEYLNKYSDTSVYFLTWGNGNGKRIYIQGNFINGLTDTLKSYTCFEHNEKDDYYQPVSYDKVVNQDPEYQTGKSWFNTRINAEKYNLKFNVDNPLPGTNAIIYAKLISEASNLPTQSHILTMRVNDQLVDSISVNRNDIFLLGKKFPASILLSGQNTLTIHNHYINTTTNSVLYDWYELEYLKTIKAYNDSLIFQIRDSIVKKERVIKIDNVNSSLFMLYKIKPIVKKIEGYQIVGNAIIFTDTVSRNDTYLILPLVKVLSPKFYYKKQFINLRNNSRSASYIGVTHTSLLNSAASYINFIGNSYNLKTSLIFTEDIYDEFAYGYPTPEGIKYFLKIIFQNWAAPKPLYISLLGSACYDYKRNYFRLNGKELNSNLVPSFGEPVSDSWFTMFDSTNALIQQILVGRIPARTNEELNFYQQKHQNYISHRFDKFNKSAIYFSGGDSNDSTQLKQFKYINDNIINMYSKPVPFSMINNHFYKTAKPITDFGPFDISYVKNIISEGGLFISYIGHSGTRTWDNSISEPYQLDNKYNRGSLITDFGCSTNRFAEPDVESFGALFVIKGQAIGYVGNSSLGFTNTSTTVPAYFYESILKDTIRVLGASHYSSKLKMFSRLGTTGTYRIFALTNLLSGDPVVSLSLPIKPNLRISLEDISINNTEINDQIDSVSITINYNNWGKVVNDSFNVSIQDWSDGQLNTSLLFKKKLPELSQTITFKLPIKGKPGEHILKINLDSQSKIDEIYEDDNLIEYRFNVPTLSLRLVQYNQFASQTHSNVTILSQSNKTTLLSSNLIVEYDTTLLFNHPTVIKTDIDTFATNISLVNLENNKRYWVRARLDIPDTLWSNTISIYKNNTNAKFSLNDEYSFMNQILSGLQYSNGLYNGKDTIFIGIKSGGGNVSKYGSISKNGLNLLPNTFSWGMGLAIFDSTTFNVDTAQTFWYGDWTPGADSLANLINRAPNGKIIALCVIDDATGLWGFPPKLKAAIKSLGSTLVDSIGFRYPWLLLSRKGAAYPVIKEIVKPNTYPEILTFDTLFIKNREYGKLISNKITNSSGWEQIQLNFNSPSNSELKVRPLGIKKDGIIDSLEYLNFISGVCKLNSISHSIYPSLKFLFEFKVGENGTPPKLNSVNVNYIGNSELGLNYQCFEMNKDTFIVGEEADIKFFINNIGESTAYNFKVKLETIYPNNSRDTIWTTNIDSLIPGNRKYFSVKTRLPLGERKRSFYISVDPGNSVSELFKDNNYYSVAYHVNPDTNKPTLKLTFDDIEILDGDYISPTPNIRVELNSNSLLPILNKSAVEVYLNNEKILLADSNFHFQNTNPKVTVIYKPTLQSGEYQLKVFGKDSSGNQVDSAGITKSFLIENKTKLLNVYNYPNPFSSETYFTFKLTHMPDEIKIKVFTVTGRLVREIKLLQSQLNYDFNRVFWDGRDEDGDLLSNGIYFYKIIMKQNNKTETIINKIAILR